MHLVLMEDMDCDRWYREHPVLQNCQWRRCGPVPCSKEGWERTLAFHVGGTVLHPSLHCRTSLYQKLQPACYTLVEDLMIYTALESLNLFDPFRQLKKWFYRKPSSPHMHWSQVLAVSWTLPHHLGTIFLCMRPALLLQDRQ